MSFSTALVWLDHDLRLVDNPALYHAAEQAQVVAPVFIWAPEEYGAYPPGGASKVWLHHSLLAFQAQLNKLNIQLTIRKGPSLELLLELAQSLNVEAVYWNSRYTPVLRARDEKIKEALQAAGIRVHTFAAHLLHEPPRLRTQSGGPYHVFTPFWKKFQRTVSVSAPLPQAPLSGVHRPSPQTSSLPVSELGLSALAQSGVDWASSIRKDWTIGEQAAQERLAQFIKTHAEAYALQRNYPHQEGTSRLSPHLHFGELSPRQVWHALSRSLPSDIAEPFLRQLAWREFSYHLLYHYPDTPHAPLKSKFAAFPWTSDPEPLHRWQKGKTGYPIIDAGMRQLWQTGWMHNRVRMLVASFLTKDLMIPWQEGAAWFWDTLVDANLANNTMGWQWAAGSGADAQPFFRIFNPVSQSERYDPEGAFIKRFVPALAALPASFIHAPWTAPPAVLKEAGVRLGNNYPHPMVTHEKARERALRAYRSLT